MVTTSILARARMLRPFHVHCDHAEHDVNVIRHDHVRVHEYVWLPQTADPNPAVDKSAPVICRHLSASHIAQQALAVLDTDRDEVVTRLRVVVALQAMCWLPPFVPHRYFGP